MADVTWLQSTRSKTSAGTLAGDEEFRVVDNPSGTPVTRKTTVDAIVARGTARYVQDTQAQTSAGTLNGDEEIRVVDNPSGAPVLRKTTVNAIASRFAVTLRETLTANRTYFVAASGGSDSNTGLTSGAPLATIQAAVDKFKGIDPRGFECRVQLLNGTHVSAVTLVINTPLLGRQPLIISGDSATPANAQIRRTTQGPVITIDNGCSVVIDGMLCRNDEVTLNSTGFFVTNQSLAELKNVTYGHAGIGAQVFASGLSRVIIGDGLHEIVGNALAFLNADANSEISCINRTITLTGSRAYSGGFARAVTGGQVRVTGCTFVGSATGRHFFGVSNAVIFTGLPVDGLPGDTAGTLASGAQYL